MFLGRIPADMRAALAAILTDAQISGRVPFSKTDAECLAEAFVTDNRRWSWLEASSFDAISLVFIFAETCQAKDEGLYRLYASLRDIKAGNDRTAYKKIAGEKVVTMFTSFFLDVRNSLSTRRWAGLLLYEFLEAIENRIILRKAFERLNTWLPQIGKLLIGGLLNILRHISAMLICRMGSDFDNTEKLEFLRNVFSEVSGFEKGETFPSTAEPWSNEVFRYLEKMDMAREQSHLK